MTAAVSACAQTANEARTVETLRQELTERDTRLAELQRRVEQLESRLAAPVGEQVAQAPAAQPVQGEAPPAPAPVPSVPPVSPPAPAAIGQFEVDEEAVERALERALVQRGALVLPPGMFEIDPSLQYTRAELSAPAFLTTANGQVLVTNTIRRDILTASLAARLGLPYEAQIEVEVPFRYEDRSTAAFAGFTGVQDRSTEASGLGDIELRATKGLFRERDGWPDLLASLTWDTDTGDDDDGIRTGSGFNEVQGTLTAVRRIDPLAFVASVSYTTAFEKDDRQPGNRFGLTFGTILAASPETSLRLFLEQEFNQETEIRGVGVPGSDTTSAVLTLGSSIVVSRQALVDVSVGVGLTDDAPDYTVMLSVPIRLGRLWD